MQYWTVKKTENLWEAAFLQPLRVLKLKENQDRREPTDFER